MVAEDRRAGRGGDRQLVGLALRRRRAADRARVNADAVSSYRKNIIANPNCSTAQLVVALKPLRCGDHQARRGLDLSVGVGRRQDGRRAVRADQGGLHREQSHQIPQAHRVQLIRTSVFMEDGYTRKSGRWWPRPEDPRRSQADRPACACRCSPGHSEAVNIEFSRSASTGARGAAQGAGLLVIDKREPGGYVTPYESAGEDHHISRIRETRRWKRFGAVVRVGQPAQGHALNAIRSPNASSTASCCSEAEGVR